MPNELVIQGIVVPNLDSDRSFRKVGFSYSENEMLSPKGVKGAILNARLRLLKI